MRLRVLFSALVLCSWIALPGLVRAEQADEEQSNNEGQEFGPLTAVEKYLQEVLRIEGPDLSELSPRLKFKRYIRKSLGKAAKGEKKANATPEQIKKFFESYFADTSAVAIQQIYQTVQMGSYNNAVVLAKPGVGKTFLDDQLVGHFTFGVTTPTLDPLLGIARNASGENVSRKASQIKQKSILGNTDLVMITSNMLTRNNTPEGGAAQKSDDRVKTNIHDIAMAARRGFQQSGRRTLFVIEEIATFEQFVHEALKTFTDPTGYRLPTDPLERAKDCGYTVLLKTTPLEWMNKVVRGDSAIQRRFIRINLEEPSEEEAFRIVRKKADTVWEPVHGFKMSDEALRFIIQKRALFDSPPLAMPGSIIRAGNQLYPFFDDLTRESDAQTSGTISLKDAQVFVKTTMGVTDIWLEGPNAITLAAEVKKLVFGQDDVVDKISQRIAAHYKYGKGPLVIFLGGSSNSGKDTLAKAFSRVLYGHDSNHTLFSLGAGSDGFGIESIIEGPPRGNHDSATPPLLIEKLEEGPSATIVIFNETKDANNSAIDKFKVFLETGEVRSKGNDARMRPIHHPIFILGQWGEEYFTGKSDAESDEIYANLTQEQIEQAFKMGKDEDHGHLSKAILDRGLMTGGAYILKPVARKLYPGIAQIKINAAIKHLKIAQNIDLTTDESVIKLAIDMLGSSPEKGPRALNAIIADFTETALSNANDRGMPLNGISVAISADAQKNIVVKQKDTNKSWKFAATDLMRFKTTCVSDLTTTELAKKKR